MKGDLVPRLIQIENLLGAALSQADIVVDAWRTVEPVPEEFKRTIDLARNIAATLQSALFLIGPLNRNQ